MRRECRERFPCRRGLAIPTCITARAWRTYRDASWDRQLAVSFEVGGRENVLRAFPAHSQTAILRIWQEAHGLSWAHPGQLSELFMTQFIDACVRHQAPTY